MNEPTYFQIAPRINKFLIGWKESGKSIVLNEKLWCVFLFSHSIKVPSTAVFLSVLLFFNWGKDMAMIVIS